MSVIILIQLLCLFGCKCEPECSKLNCQINEIPYKQIVGYGDDVERHGGKHKHNRLIRNPVFQCTCLQMKYETDKAKLFKLENLDFNAEIEYKF